MMLKSVLLALCVSTLAFAQGNTGNISGTVTDPTGAAVPGAAVTGTNAATGATAKTTTNEQGAYALPSLLAGSYRISVSKSGFRSEARSGVEVNAGVSVTVNIRLEVGQTSETVEVSAGAEMVQSTSAEVTS